MTAYLENALIGYTGFVGSNLNQTTQFDNVYNSKNIHEIQDKNFNKVICAGVSAVKWWANKNPEQDRMQIDNLLTYLATIKANTFILISTVDVYSQPNKVDEDCVCNISDLHAYGLNRLYVEEFVKTHFSHHHIIRLPALFGIGLKKNIIYDFINNNGLENINPHSSFQWYPLQRLTNDIAIVEQADIPLINFAAEPITTALIQQRYFPTASIGSLCAPTSHYDMRTKYNALFGKSEPYIIQQEEILFELEQFIKNTPKVLS